MANVNPNGDQKYWFDGETFGGVLNGTNDQGAQKYWTEGQPTGYIYPSGAPPVTTPPRNWGFIIH